MPDVVDGEFLQGRRGVDDDRFGPARGGMVRIAFCGGEEGDAGRAGERGHVHRAGIVADDEDGGFGERDDLEKIRTRHKAFDARLALDDVLRDLAFGLAADDGGLDAGVFIGDVTLKVATNADNGNANARSRASESSTEFIGGAGVDWNFMDALTARAEWQPLGPFADGSDDFEGDLTRQAKPRGGRRGSAPPLKNTTRRGGRGWERGAATTRCWCRSNRRTARRRRGPSSRSWNAPTR